jgi:hypothetical protein
MPSLPDLLFRSFFIGVGATLFLDAWSAIRTRFFGIPFPDYTLVGRWIGHFPAGRFAHASIASSPAIACERLIGWAAHYATGIAFAAILLAVSGPDWTRHPTPWPAIIFGLATVAFPFLLMQPGMGAGIAASKAPDPRTARMRSLLSHLVFGIGLYVSALLLAPAQLS